MSLERVGVRLTDTAIQRGRRPDVPPRIGVTERDLAVFAWLEHHRFATTQMLATLFWSTNGTAVRERLKLLHDAGFLDKIRPHSVGGGSTEWIYFLTRRGWQALRNRYRAALNRLPFGDVNDLSYVGHDLQLDAMLLELAAREFPGRGPLIDRLPFEWQGPPLGHVPRGGGASPENLRIGPAWPEGHVLATGKSLRGILEPDATLIGPIHASDRPFAVMIEYDRTHRPAKQRDRWRRYDRLLTETWRAGRFAGFHTAPVVIYVVSTTSAIRGFVKEADKHLTAWIGPRLATPKEGAYPGRDRILFTSRERLLAGDWTTEAVPAHPPDVRGTTTVHSRHYEEPFLRWFAKTTTNAA